MVWSVPVKHNDALKGLKRTGSRITTCQTFQNLNIFKSIAGHLVNKGLADIPMFRSMFWRRTGDGLWIYMPCHAFRILKTLKRGSLVPLDPFNHYNVLMCFFDLAMFESFWHRATGFSQISRDVGKGWKVCNDLKDYCCNVLKYRRNPAGLDYFEICHRR